MLQSLLADRFQLTLHTASHDQPVYALIATRTGIAMKPADARAAPQPDPANSPDTPPTLGFFGATQDQTGPNPDGPGTVTLITGPRIGAVRQLDTPDSRQRWESPAISLAGLADLLDKVTPVPLPIVDQTGDPGRYQFRLELSLDEYAHPGAVDPSEANDNVIRVFNDALRKLGLQLQRRTISLPTLFVDRLNSSPTAN